jgi:phosphoglycerate dehydrogenase-like enzyme
VGYDHIDARSAAERGIIVTHTPGVPGEDAGAAMVRPAALVTRSLTASGRARRASARTPSMNARSGRIAVLPGKQIASVAPAATTGSRARQAAH